MVPSPMNPLLHVQVKEPNVSAHVALSLQRLMESHSLMSIIIIKTLLILLATHK